MEGWPGGVLVQEKLLRSLAQVLSVGGEDGGVRSWRKKVEVEMNVNFYISTLWLLYIYK